MENISAGVNKCGLSNLSSDKASLYQAAHLYQEALDESCLNNKRRIIDNHNKHILNFHVNSNATVSDNSKECNCRRIYVCSLNGNCREFVNISTLSQHASKLFSIESVCGLRCTVSVSIQVMFHSFRLFAVNLHPTFHHP